MRCQYDVTGLSPREDDPVTCPECGRTGLPEWILTAPPWPGWPRLAIRTSGAWTLNVAVLLGALELAPSWWPAAIVAGLAGLSLLVTGLVVPKLVVTFWVERLVPLEHRTVVWVGCAALVALFNAGIFLALRLLFVMVFR